jgi:hypothetical protein
MNKETKHLKLLKAHNNNLKLSDMNLSDKFADFENSRLNQSETLLYEANVRPTRFKKYSRGQIVKVRFGVNIGSEFSGDHYAIIVSKKDTMINPILHVIPLTSKKHNYNLDIGNILYNENEISKLEEKLNLTEDKDSINKINTCIKYYKSKKNKTSYACIKHLKTISKLSICKTMNEYDYLDRLKVSNELLHTIDEEILKEYTLL